MKHGNITCSCGYNMYFETIRDSISCLMCNKELNVSAYPIKEEGVEDDSGVQTSGDI